LGIDDPDYLQVLGAFLLVVGGFPALLLLVRWLASRFDARFLATSADLAAQAAVASIGSIIGFLSAISESSVAVTVISSLFAVLSGAFVVFLKPIDGNGGHLRAIALLLVFFLSAFAALLFGLEYAERGKKEAFCKRLFAEHGDADDRVRLFENDCREFFGFYYFRTRPDERAQ